MATGITARTGTVITITVIDRMNARQNRALNLKLIKDDSDENHFPYNIQTAAYRDDF